VQVVASQTVETQPVLGSAPLAVGSQRGEMPVVQSESVAACAQVPLSQVSSVQSIESLHCEASVQGPASEGAASCGPASRGPASGMSGMRVQPTPG
jgi:hypothetical protein